MRDVLKAITGLALAGAMVITAIPAHAAEEGDVANSFRYHNGQNVAIEKKTATPSSLKLSNSSKYTAKGIDVSYHNGKISWGTVKKAKIDYAILRCGYGQDEKDQDDKQWENNVKGCNAQGIPFGTYLYSYAKSASAAKGEANHTLRLIKGKKFAYPVYYDLEEEAVRKQTSSATRANIAQTYCNMIQKAGYKVGIYANTNWFTNYLPKGTFNQWPRWVAQYDDTCTFNGDIHMWQYTSRGKVGGMTGNSGYVDMNYLISEPEYTSSLLPSPAKPSLTVTRKDNNTVTLKWSSKGADDSTIQYATDSGFKENAKTVKVAATGKSTPDKSVSHSHNIDVTQGKTYYFRVRLSQTYYNKTMTGSYSNAKSIKLEKKSEKDMVLNKAAITSLSAGDNSFTVAWNKYSSTADKEKSEGAVSYIEYATNKDFSSAKVKTVSTVGKQTGSQTISGLARGTYYVRVRLGLSDKSRYGSYSAVKSIAVHDPKPSLSKPVIKSITTTRKQAVLKIDQGTSKLAGKTITPKAQLQYSLKKDFTGATSVNIQGTTVKKTITGLKSGKTYYFRLRHFTTYEGSKIYGAFSAKKSIKVK